MAVKFTVLDLNYILAQIEMAEAGQPPVNPLLSFGLREVAGTNNNLVPGQTTFGSSDQIFPTLTDPLIQTAAYAATSGLVVDAQPRMISELISSQNASNPAALAAQAQELSQLGAGYQNITLPGADGIYGINPVTGINDDTAGIAAGADGIIGINPVTGINDDITTFGNLATPTDASSSSSTIPGLAQSLFINNITPDNGLSSPSNSWFTFFGQFFDHGLDKITTDAASGQVFIPLMPDDPLYVVGGHSNFMILTRAANQPGPDKILGTADDVRQYTNQDSPFIDQSQTYGSDPSHQAFLRAYMIGIDGRLHSTGALLSHAKLNGTDGMATWGDLKANAANFLGIRITDADIGNVPLLATDAYGNLILGAARGLAQIVVNNANGTTSLIEGNLAAPITIPANVARTGNAFINDMAHSASPVDDFGNKLLPDLDTTLGNAPAAGFYDNELLDKHYVAGDGRVNENIGLTAVQDIFHNEHDRLLAQIQLTVQNELNTGNISFATNWVLPGVVLTGPVINAAGVVITPATQIQANQWNGERLFQAAKFGTETEYQHLVFEDFARYVAPSIHVASGVNVHINPAISSEFANVVYRFGHSMLDENINLYVLGADGKPVINAATGQPTMTQEGLIQAFTNPMQFANNADATADIVLGTVNQVSSEIDEFVTGSLQNNLLGLPLDLASLNIARGRDTGVAPLNLVRNQLFTETGDSQLKAYTSWADFGSQIKHPESLVNFIAAYGTHPSVTSATTMAAKRAAAQALVDKGTIGVAFNPTDAASLDAFAFLHSTGAYASPPPGVLRSADARTIHDSNGVEATWSTGSVTGVDNIDMWIGGLAEKQSLFGGVLGSTFEYIFRTQMEALQDADRLYYLPRIEGMDYEESLQDNSLTQLIQANTGIKHLPGNIFLTPEYTVEASTYFNADGSVKDPTGATWLHNPLTGALLVNATAGGKLQFLGDDNFLGNTIVLGGTEGNDTLTAGAADDDTVWGDGGNDILDAGGGADFLFGGDGNDLEYGGQGDDVIHGDAGNDTIYGGDGVDNIFGGDGNDYIDAGRGSDIVLGGLGNDIIIGGEGQDELTGNEGDDWIESKGGQGHLMFGDSGAPTGQTPLYSGNDVMIGGIAGGDIMKGFNGDDIMLGLGSFTKFIGGLGYDWASYEQALHGVDADLNRKELVVANGTENTIRDIFQSTEGVSGSSYDDILTGTNTTRLLATKDELDNTNLIIGLPDFFAPGALLFDAGNIMLGGAGSDQIIGGGGDDVIDGDAWLHVGLAQGYVAGSQIIREILYDPNGNNFLPAHRDANGNPVAASGIAKPANVDIAVYNDVMANYDIALFGPDAEGFLTIDHARAAAAIVGGNPQGLLGGDDGTDRIRHIERLQFSDVTVAIDSEGNLLSPLVNDPNYDAVPIGTPTVTEKDPNGNIVDPAVAASVGNILTASVAGITDADNIVRGGNAPNPTGIPAGVSFQWQVQDFLSAKWLDIVGATSPAFTVTTFQDGNPLRVQVSYVDGKGYTESLNSAPTALVTLAAGVNTPPFVVPQQQFNGISDTTALQGSAFDYFSPFTAIFNDAQTAPASLIYTASMVNGSSLASNGLAFTFDPVTGSGEFKTTAAGADRILGNADDNKLIAPGQIAIRVTATDAGGLSATDVFNINVVPRNLPPVAVNDTYTASKGVTLTVLASNGVMTNDSDPNGDTFTASLVTGPTNGTLVFSPTGDGTFTYKSNPTFVGQDSFTYRDTDSALATNNTTAIATVTINVLAFDNPPVASPLAESTTTLEDSSVRGTLLQGTDIDGNGNGVQIPLIYSIVAGSATNGTVTLVDVNGVAVTSNTTGAYVFTPTPNYATNSAGSPIVDALFGGPGTFQYQLSDTVKLSQPKTVSVNVTPVDDGPGTLTLSGVLAVGGTLTAAIPASGAGSDPEGIGIAPVFKWLNNGVVMAGVTGSTYTLVAADAGHTLSVSATYTDGQNFLTTVATTTTNPAGAVLVKPTVTTPTAPVNTTVTASSTLNNLFGAPAAITATTTYGWQTSLDQGITWTTVAPTGATFSPGTTNAAGEYIRAVASYVDGAGVTQSVPSLPTHYINDTGTGDILTGVAGVNNIIFGGAGNHLITPGAGTYVNTGSGNNTIFATIGDGNGIYVGGAGIDTYDMSQTSAPATVTLLNDGILPPGTATSAQTGSDTLTGIENVTGGTGNDVIGGNASANTLIGGLGDDQLRGGGGNDSLNGGAGNDLLDGGTGIDTMIGGTGNDITFVDNQADVVIENVGEGTDTVNSAVSYSLMVAAEVAQEVETLAANPLATGGAGVTLTGNQYTNAITGNSGNDTLDGSNGVTNERLTGAAGNDTLIGGVGNDILDGGTGNDTMIGGAGNDIYLVDSAGDVVIELAGGGIDTVNATLASYTLTTNVEKLNYTGTVPAAGTEFTGTGNASDNVIAGGAGNDVLSGGGSGNDTLNGGAGNDLLTGGTGNDILNGGTGADTMIGGAGNDTYFVDNVGDVVTEALNSGNDTVVTSLNTYTPGANVENLMFNGTGAFSGTGNAATSTGTAVLKFIIGSATSANTLDDGGAAGAGYKLDGGAGNDTYVVRNTGDVIIEAANAGTDTINTTLNTISLNAAALQAGNVENLTFIGTGAFNGTGNGLNNVITGGAGNDTLTGGAGNDTFVFNTKAFGADIITDFTAHSATGTPQDLIDLTGLGIKAADFGKVGKFSIANVPGGGSLISFTGAPFGTIALSHVQANAISVADFKGLQ